MIDLVTIGYADSLEHLEEISWMACITRRLVIVQYDLSVRIHLTGTIHPHVMLVLIGSVFFRDQNRSLICLKHMIVIHLLM